MNKLVSYLNQHLLGEVTADDTVRRIHSTDGSIVAQVPDMVAFPYDTSDLRKLVSFSAQLAEKGHTLPIVVRGAATDTSGGATGNGLVASLLTHMNQVFEYEPKQRLVRLQPGVRLGALRQALRFQGTGVPQLNHVSDEATLGGVIASTGTIEPDWIDQLEVVLASGDVLQTKRYPKRELSKLKARPGFEGELYRGIIDLLDENETLLDEIGTDSVAGYARLADVRGKDGSIDLTPLFVGSEGTLGIVSEMILKTEYVSEQRSVVVAVFTNAEDARDALDKLQTAEPASIEFFDKTLVAQAEVHGKVFSEVDAARDRGGLGGVLCIEMNDMSQRTRAKKAKKVMKLLKDFDVVTAVTDDIQESELRSYESIKQLALLPTGSDRVLAPVLDGAIIPPEKIELFFAGVAELAGKHRLEFGIYGRPLENAWSVRAELPLSTMSGRQANLKLVNDFAALVEKCAGSLPGTWGEGRVMSAVSYRSTDDRLVALYAQVKQLFDPRGILSPGVKQPGELRDLVRQLRPNYAPGEPDGLSRF